MRKSTIFISAVLTTFALVMLYRVASAYNESKSAAEVAAEPTSVPAPTATEPPIPEETEVVLGPEEAAKIAAQVVGNASLLSAETSSFNGVAAYLITFTNNDLVYVGLDGQILSVQVAPEIVNVAPPAKKKDKDRGGQRNKNTSGAGNRQGDHDDDDDDDN